MQGTASQLVLIGVQVADIVGKRRAQGHARAGALDGKVQMVGQNEGQVGIEVAVQFLVGVLRNVVGSQENFFRNLLQQRIVFVVHIVEGALDLAQIFQLIGGGRKPDSLAEHNHFVALGIPGQGAVVVDLFDDFHAIPPGQNVGCKLFLTKK